MKQVKKLSAKSRTSSTQPHASTILSWQIKGWVISYAKPLVKLQTQQVCWDCTTTNIRVTAQQFKPFPARSLLKVPWSSQTTAALWESILSGTEGTYATCCLFETLVLLFFFFSQHSPIQTKSIIFTSRMQTLGIIEIVAFASVPFTLEPLKNPWSRNHS